MPPRYSKLQVDSDQNKMIKKSNGNYERQKRKRVYNERRQSKIMPVNDYLDQSNMSNVSDVSLSSAQKAAYYRRRLKDLLSYEKAIRQAFSHNTVSYSTDDNGQYKETTESELPDIYYCQCDDDMNENPDADADDGSNHDENQCEHCNEPIYTDTESIYDCTCDDRIEEADADADADDTVYCHCDDEDMDENEIIDDEKIIDENIPDCQCEN